MNKFLVFGYIAIGFLAGFAFGYIPERDGSLPIERLAAFVSVILLILLWQLFESASHKRHLVKWEIIRSRGKWRFIFIHYVLGRGVVILPLVYVPLLLNLKFGGYSFLVLSLTATMVLLMFIVFGHIEWLRCEEDFSVRSMRRAAERATSSSPA